MVDGEIHKWSRGGEVVCPATGRATEVVSKTEAIYKQRRSCKCLSKGRKEEMCLAPGLKQIDEIEGREGGRDS
jgi:hypothetical protein